MTTREQIIDWLRDAYAMERGLETTLKKESGSSKLTADVREKAAMHLEETKRHAEEVKAALQSLGADTSALKTAIGVMTETAKGLGTKPASDEPVKDMITAYSNEHFEIACYRALAAAAEQAGLPEVTAVCNRILPDEERMAHWIEQALPSVVRSHLPQESIVTARM